MSKWYTSSALRSCSRCAYTYKYVHVNIYIYTHIYGYMYTFRYIVTLISIFISISISILNSWRRFRCALLVSHLQCARVHVWHSACICAWHHLCGCDKPHSCSWGIRSPSLQIQTHSESCHTHEHARVTWLVESRQRMCVTRIVLPHT